MRNSIVARAIIVATLAFTTHYAHAIQPVDPLQHYDYRDLYLMKTLPSKGGGVACFITNDKRAVWVRKGEYVGKRFGRVLEITDRYVVISEQVEVDFGQWVGNLFKYPVGTLDEMKSDPRCNKPSIGGAINSQHPVSETGARAADRD